MSISTFSSSSSNPRFRESVASELHHEQGGYCCLFFVYNNAYESGCIIVSEVLKHGLVTVVFLIEFHLRSDVRFTKRKLRGLSEMIRADIDSHVICRNHLARILSASIVGIS